MSWSTGSNVFVAIPEKDDLAAGKVLKENKSGTVRVQLDDGTKLTVGAEEIFENPNKTPKSRQRSRSPARKSTGARARSPGRPKSPARAASTGRKRSTSRSRKPTTTPKTKEEKPEKASTAKKAAEKKKEEQVSSPSMTLRVRRWNKDDNIDSDTDDTKTKKKGKETESPSKAVLEYGGAVGLLLMLLIIIGVTFGSQMMFRSGSFNLRGLDWRKLVAQWPKWDWLVAGQIVGFWAVQLVLALLPVGPIENALPGSTGPRQYRRNGLIAAIVTIGALLIHRRYFGVAMTKAQILTALPIWAATSLVAGILLGIYCCWKGSRAPVSQQNPATVATGKVYSFFMGKQINPVIGKLHLKMFVFKLGLIETLLLNLLIFLNLEPTGYAQLAAIALPSLYCLDALVFEQTMLTSYGVQAEGFGTMFTVGMGLYPFLAAILPLYSITAKVELQTWCVALICLLSVIGTLINRLSCNQKYRFRKNPMDPAVSHLETLPTARGKKLLVSGWWGLVRHPNYLGDILIHLSFGLIAGFGHALPWFLPLFTIPLFFQRVGQDNRHCQAKYGDAWSRYCDRVKYRVLPKIY